MKKYLCEVSVKHSRHEPSTMLDVELIASSPELAEKRVQFTLWSRYRHLPLENITITSTKEIGDA